MPVKPPKNVRVKKQPRKINKVSDTEIGMLLLDVDEKIYNDAMKIMKTKRGPGRGKALKMLATKQVKKLNLSGPADLSGVKWDNVVKMLEPMAMASKTYAEAKVLVAEKRSTYATAMAQRALDTEFASNAMAEARSSGKGQTYEISVAKALVRRANINGWNDTFQAAHVNWVELVRALRSPSPKADAFGKRWVKHRKTLGIEWRGRPEDEVPLAAFIHEYLMYPNNDYQLDSYDKLGKNHGLYTKNRKSMTRTELGKEISKFAKKINLKVPKKG